MKKYKITNFIPVLTNISDKKFAKFPPLFPLLASRINRGNEKNVASKKIEIGPVKDNKSSGLHATTFGE